MSYHFIFERRFSMAHRLIQGCSEKCATPHGHNEFVKITLSSSKKILNHCDNMIEPFEETKARWHDFIDKQIDHAFQLADNDPLIEFFKQNEPERLKRLVITPGDPTTEMLCACLMSKLHTFLTADQLALDCIALLLEETPTNSVSLNGLQAYKAHLPNKKGWWNRNDMSINDF